MSWVSANHIKVRSHLLGVDYKLACISDFPNLIHVVFRDTSFTHYDVQDNMLNLVVSNQQLFET